MRLNTSASKPKIHTHEGGTARHIPIEAQLRRAVLSCLLWEKTFYESGEDIANRIADLADRSPKCVVASLAIEARNRFHLRHVPLLLLVALVKKGGEGVADTIAATIGRPDEMTELLAMYWHFNPRGDTAKIPSQLKRETFERLLREGKLGYMALLRNLRGMDEAGVDDDLIREAIVSRKGSSRVLPFRYVAAARAAPRFERSIDQALCESVMDGPQLKGKTFVLVDVSGSMNVGLSEKSDLTRMDAAAALASVINGDVRMFSFSAGNSTWFDTRSIVTVEVPPRRGMAGIDAIKNSQRHGGTLLGQAVREANLIMRPEDRLIVITDEQSSDRIPDPVAKRAYMINVSSYVNGVGYGRWVHIDGFSEAVLRFISEYELERG